MDRLKNEARSWVFQIRLIVQKKNESQLEWIIWNSSCRRTTSKTISDDATRIGCRRIFLQSVKKAYGYQVEESHLRKHPQLVVLPIVVFH